jgi:nicotinic acid mononucleotide adenylyltransferase
MPCHQRAHGLGEVGPWEGSQSLGRPERDLGCPRAPVDRGIAYDLPADVAPAAHGGHRIGVDGDAISGALLRLLRPGPPRLEVLDGRGPGRRVGIVPGSFDPMTVAHEALAMALRDRRCDLVLLLYSPRTMPKEGPAEPPLMTPEARVASLLAWSVPRAGFGTALCSHGLIAHQATAAGRAFPGADMLFGLGSDKVVQLLDPSWYDDAGRALSGLFRSARVAYGVRAGEADRAREALDREPRWRDRIDAVELPAALEAVSSSRVRRLAREGADVSDLVPDEVMPFVGDPRGGG